jgi:hypothetical protein
MMFFVRFINVAVAAGLIVVIAMNARRVGRAVWLIAPLPLLWIVLTFTATLFSFVDRSRELGMAIGLLDAVGTSLSAIMIVIACAILR